LQLSIKEISELNIKGVAIDSRGDVEGCLFVPLVGENFDGHDYIDMALQKGAAYALTERDGPGIKVENTLKALQDLAVYARNRFTGAVVAITGSAGKTTTKEMVASVLSQKYNTLKTQGNLNNHIGLPLTLLRRQDDHEAMVLEMGMNHMGEISVLSKIGKPTICLITNIGDAHIENLGSREGILKAKSEIFEGLTQGGTVILNGDDPLLFGLPKVAQAGKTIYCHMEKEAGIYATNISRKGLRGISCLVNWNEESIEVEIPLPGDHMIMNALMAFAVGLETGMKPQQIAEGIKKFKPTGHRMAISQVNEMTIVNDTYNASPSSMKAAIEMLADSGKGRKVCILGDMFELGDHAEAMHKEVGEFAAEKKIDLLITIGTLSSHMNGNIHFPSKEAFLKEWRKHVQAGDIILIKASRGMALESIAEEMGAVKQ